MRPLLGGLPRLDVVPGTIAFVAVMIGTVTFDGLSQGRAWSEVSAARSTTRSPRLGLGADGGAASSPRRSGCSSASRSSPASTRSAAARAHRLAPALSAERLRRGFVHSLVPIALVYVAAHYLTFLLFEGQGIAYLLSDPLGRGWDLFGTASAAVDYGVISQNQAWYAQVACVVAGHVAALTLAHDRALALYGAGARGGAIAVRDAGDHGRLHDAGAVAARAGGHGMSARARRCVAALAALALAGAGCGAVGRRRRRRRARTASSTSRRSRRTSTRSTSTRGRRTSC